MHIRVKIDRRVILKEITAVFTRLSVQNEEIKNVVYEVFIAIFRIT